MVKLSGEYLRGIIGGIGLELSALIRHWLAKEPTQLSLMGAALACVGGFSAYWIQNRTAQEPNP